MREGKGKGTGWAQISCSVHPTAIPISYWVQFFNFLVKCLIFLRQAPRIPRTFGAQVSQSCFKNILSAKSKEFIRIITPLLLRILLFMIRRKINSDIFLISWVSFDEASGILSQKNRLNVEPPSFLYLGQNHLPLLRTGDLENTHFWGTPNWVASRIAVPLHV